jgi:hypothetical protein
LKRQVLQPAFQRGLKQAGNFRFFYEDELLLVLIGTVTGTEFAMEKTYLGIHLVTLQVRKYIVITVKRPQFSYGS